MLPLGLHGMIENNHGDDDKTKRPTPDHLAKHLAVETGRSGFDLAKNIYELKKALSPGAGASPAIVGSVLDDLKTLAGDTVMSALGPLSAAFGVVMRVRRIVQDAKFRAQAQLNELTSNLRGELLEAVDNDSDNIGARLRHKIKASIGRLKGTQSSKDDPIEVKRQALLKTIKLLGDIDASAATKEEEIREVATLPKELQDAEIAEVMKTVNEGLETAKEAVAEIPVAELHQDQQKTDVPVAVLATTSERIQSVLIVADNRNEGVSEKEEEPDLSERICKRILDTDPSVPWHIADIRNGHYKGLRTLTFPAAKKLQEMNMLNQSPYFSDLRTLTADVAAVLMQSKGTLYLPEITSIDADVAHELAKHDGSLWLTSLKTISPEVARELAKHKGYLNVAGLETLTDEALTHLFTHNGEMNISSLTRLGNVDIEDFASKYFIERDYQSLRKLKQMTDAQLRSFATHMQGGSIVIGMQSLSDSQAKILGEMKGDYSLDYLEDISENGICSLAANARGLNIAVKKLTDRSAQAIASICGKVNLWRLEVLSDRQAEILSHHKGQEITFSRIETLSDAQAASLSQYEGIVNLTKLSSVSDAGLQSLALGKAQIKTFGECDERIKQLREQAGLLKP